jgi:hypothetical protein
MTYFDYFWKKKIVSVKNYINEMFEQVDRWIFTDFFVGVINWSLRFSLFVLINYAIKNVIELYKKYTISFLEIVNTRSGLKLYYPIKAICL